LRVPPDKAEVPGLKARCGGCQTVFVVAEASLALAVPLEPPPAAHPTSPPPAGAAPAVSPRTPVEPAAQRPPAPLRSRRSPGGWRRCTNHPSVRSHAVCSACGNGWCADCVGHQGAAMICPPCDALCLAVADQEAKEAKARMRSRPLTDELGTVFRYPFSDATAFLILAVVVGAFSVAASLAAFGAGLAILCSQGLLYAYAFSAINRVSTGDLGSFMPSVGDVSDLVQPLRVGMAALLISTGPLLLVAFLHPPDDMLAALGVSAPAGLGGSPAPAPEPTLPAMPAIVEEAAPAGEASAALAAQEEGEDGEEESGAADGAVPLPRAAEHWAEEPRIPAWVFLAYVAALLWKVLYSPVALVAAAISRSFLTTLNPVTGLSAIGRMGTTYWSAMGVYTAVAVVDTLLVGGLALVPLAGKFLGAFVQSYTYLAIGCLLGFAVFKKAPELGLD
jgi:hypothetical protein